MASTRPPECAISAYVVNALERRWDGYACVAGRAGFMMAGQNGPGVTNLVTGLAQALRAYSPVVTLGGAHARGHQYREGF